MYLTQTIYDNATTTCIDGSSASQADSVIQHNQKAPTANTAGSTTQTLYGITMPNLTPNSLVTTDQNGNLKTAGSLANISPTFGGLVIAGKLLYT